MRDPLFPLVLAASVVLVPSVTRATIHVTDIANLTTDANPGGGNSDGTGVWFNPLSGYAESRGFLFPNPLFADGQFFLVWDNSFTKAEAEVFTQGFFSRGNGVIYESSGNLNPARFGDGTVIGAATGYQSPGAGFTDLGPTFGNWAAGGHGYLGLTMRDATGSTAGDIFYGYAEINVNVDNSITLLSFAYNDVRGGSITTVSSVPEPSTFGLSATALILGFIARRRSS